VTACLCTGSPLGRPSCGHGKQFACAGMKAWPLFLWHLVVHSRRPGDSQQLFLPMCATSLFSQNFHFTTNQPRLHQRGMQPTNELPPSSMPSHVARPQPAHPPHPTAQSITLPLYVIVVAMHGNRGVRNCLAGSTGLKGWNRGLQPSTHSREGLGPMPGSLGL
jgi:hypothetical protein